MFTNNELEAAQEALAKERIANASKGGKAVELGTMVCAQFSDCNGHGIRIYFLINPVGWPNHNWQNNLRRHPRETRGEEYRRGN